MTEEPQVRRLGDAPARISDITALYDAIVQMQEVVMQLSIMTIKSSDHSIEDLKKLTDRTEQLIEKVKIGIKSLGEYQNKLGGLDE